MKIRKKKNIVIAAINIILEEYCRTSVALGKYEKLDTQLNKNKKFEAYNEITFRFEGSRICKILFLKNKNALECRRLDFHLIRQSNERAVDTNRTEIILQT